MKETTWGGAKRPIIFLFLTLLLFPLYYLYNPVRYDAIVVHIVSFFYIASPGFFLGHFMPIVIILWMFFVGYGIGRGVVWFLRLPDAAQNLPIYTLTGWGVLSYALGGLLFLNLMSPAWILALLVTLTLAVSPALLISLKELREFEWRSSFNRLEAWIVIPILFAAFIAFCSSLMPPTQSDGLRYHLTVPQEYLRYGGFVVLPHLSFSNFPFLIEYLFLIPLAFEAISGPKLIHAFYYALSAGVVWRLGILFGSPHTGWVAVLLFVATPFAPIFASWSFIEFGLAAYTLLTFYAAIHCREALGQGRDGAARRWAIFGGLSGGWMLGCKYTALASLALFCLIALWPHRFKPSRLWLAGLAPATLMGFIAAAVASPWYIKNLVLFGNPLFPFLGSLFPTPGWSEFNDLFFQYHAGMKGNLNAIIQAPLGEKLLDFFTLPVRMTLYPGEPWHPEDFGGWPLGCLWLILGLLLLLNRRWSLQMAIFAAASFFLFIVWACTYRDIRFLLPSLGIAAPLLAMTAVSLIEERRWVRWIILLLIAHNLVKVFALTFLPFNYMPWWVISGHVTVEEYLEEISADTRRQNQAFRWLRENADPEDRVFLHGIQTPFYCPNPYLGSDWFDTDPLLQRSWTAQTSEELLDWLRERDIRYVVHDYGNINRYFWFYRLFRLPLDESMPLLEEVVSQEYAKMRYPRLYDMWLNEFTMKLRQAEARAPYYLYVDRLLQGEELQVVFDYKEPSRDGLEDGIRVLHIPLE